MGGKLNIKDVTVGFIGGGRITQLLLSAWQHKDKIPKQVWVSDSNADILENLKRTFANIVTVPGDNGKPSTCDLVFLALHPPAIAAVLDEIKGRLKSTAYLISLAPRVSIGIRQIYESRLTGLYAKLKS